MIFLSKKIRKALLITLLVTIAVGIASPMKAKAECKVDISAGTIEYTFEENAVYSNDYCIVVTFNGAEVNGATSNSNTVVSSHIEPKSRKGCDFSEPTSIRNLQSPKYKKATALGLVSEKYADTLSWTCTYSYSSEKITGSVTLVDPIAEVTGLTLFYKSSSGYYIKIGEQKDITKWIGILHGTVQPEETTPEEMTSEEMTPEETTPEETTPEETTLEETTPEETTPEETTPEETTPEETAPEETTPEETTPQETTPEETIPEETTPEETTPEETTPEETTPEETSEDEKVTSETDETEIPGGTGGGNGGTGGGNGGTGTGTGRSDGRGPGSDIPVPDAYLTELVFHNNFRENIVEEKNNPAKSLVKDTVGDTVRSTVKRTVSSTISSTVKDTAEDTAKRTAKDIPKNPEENRSVKWEFLSVKNLAITVIAAGLAAIWYILFAEGKKEKKGETECVYEDDSVIFIRKVSK